MMIMVTALTNRVFGVTVSYCAFPQNFHTRKFDEFLVWNVVDYDNGTSLKFVKYLVTLHHMAITKNIEDC